MDESIGLANLPYVEELHSKYLARPSSVPDEWQRYFAKVSLNGEHGVTTGNGTQAAHGPRPTMFPTAPLDDMIEAYRTFGHRKARIDPLNLRNITVAALEPEAYGFAAAHLSKLVVSATMPTTVPLTLQELIDRLETIYCGSIGFEFMHITDSEIKTWIQSRIESTDNRAPLDRDDQIRILARLNDAQGFEQFIRKKFLGAKSFSLEGAESLIPLLDLAIEKAAAQDIEEIVLAMAHRGRLNVLANIVGKPARDIFRDFRDPSVAHVDGSGDVKYHLGHSHDYTTRAGLQVHLSLCFNPSHLEYVNGVAAGRVRAKQDRKRDFDRRRTMALLIHGDAAFSGEGIVQETLNLGRLEAYDIGGTLHIVVNNQIGFTTPPSQARSSTYATDIAKGLQLPIFHVNGDDPESIAYVVQLALDFRAKFHQDVIIDLYCYRLLGHNEGDEPTFTQPKLYHAIAKHKNVGELYAARLIALQRVTMAEVAAQKTQVQQRLEKEFSTKEDQTLAKAEEFQGIWAGYRGGAMNHAPDLSTGVDRQRLTDLLIAQTRWPENFRPHPKIVKAVSARREMAQGNRPLDWSAAESLAWATLATEGVSIRLSGQDSARGTFSHRHAVLHDYENGAEYIPLQHLAADQARVEIYNSPLSEAGVLGFEYGYSLDSPAGLTMWEAQFGDFVNAAQVIVDQFITAAEEKWRRLSGIVLLLPHGFEGMGPEHSSARLERFLQLCAKDNIQVVNPTTPAQYFHCLRRQALSRWRKPLVIMTPKSLLRHPRSVSSLEEHCAAAQFRPVIEPINETASKPIDRVVLCSGKIFFDLEKRRQELTADQVPIIRIEQLYPFPKEQLKAALARYPAGTPLLWVQEEPENMGAWWYLNDLFKAQLPERTITVIARAAAASPATGSATRHKQQQNELIDQVFGPA